MAAPRDPTYETSSGRRARPEAIALRRWIHEWYAGVLIDPDDPASERKDAHPETIPGRFRYYEAVMAEAISKHAVETVVAVEGDVTVTAGDRMWKDALMWVREYGLVPDSWIDDTTRDLIDCTGWESVEQAVRWALRQPLDPWEGRWPLSVVESEGTAEVLRPVARELGTIIAPLRGQAGRSYLANKVAPTMYDGQIVLAIVDLDKVGGDISRSAQERLERFTGHTFDWRVIALTDEQADDPANAIVRVPRVDGREKSGPTRMVAETEALGVDTLRQILRDAIEALLPGDALVSARGRQHRQRRELERKLGWIDPLIERAVEMAMDDDEAQS